MTLRMSRATHSLWVGCIVLVLTACDSEQSRGAPAGEPGGSDADAGSGADADADGPGCSEGLVELRGACVPPVPDCAPDEVPDGQGGCMSVGPECAPPFQRRADGAPGCEVPADACPEAAVATPDGCAVVGPTQECGDAPFGRVEGGGEAGAIHVLQGAVTDDADGSRDHPFPDITSGVDAADPGGQVVVGDGDYEESVTVDKPLTLRGRCAEHVRILRPTGDDAPSAIRVTDTLDVRIAGLGVEGGLDAVLVEQSTNVVIEDVQVTGAKHYAFAFLDTGGARVERCAAIGTVPFEVGPPGRPEIGVGVAVHLGSTDALVRHCRFVDTDGRGVQIAPGATATVEENRIEGSTWEGVAAVEAGRAELRHNLVHALSHLGIVSARGVADVVEGNVVTTGGAPGIAVASEDERHHARVAGNLVSGPEGAPAPPPPGYGAGGIFVATNGSLEVVGNTVTDVLGIGVAFVPGYGENRVTDNVIRGVGEGPQADPPPPAGLSALYDARALQPPTHPPAWGRPVTVQGNVVQDATGWGIVLGGPDLGRIDVSENVVSGLRPSGDLATAIEVMGTSEAVAVTRNHVHDTMGGAFGLSAVDDATLSGNLVDELRDAGLEHPTGAHVSVGPCGSLTVRSNTFLDGTFGLSSWGCDEIVSQGNAYLFQGVEALSFSSSAVPLEVGPGLTLSPGTFKGTNDYVVGGGYGLRCSTECTVSGLTVLGARALVRGEDGHGIDVTGGPLLIEDSRFADSEGYGVWIATDAEVSVRRVEVSGNDLGGVYLEGGTASLTGLDVTANRRVGIRSEDTDLTLEATRIQRTATDGRERYGDGLVVVAGSAGVTDLRVERSERAAIAVDGATVRVDGCSLIDNRHAALAKNGGVVDWTGDCAVDGDPASEGHVEETELDLP